MNSVYFNGLDSPKDDKMIVEKIETTMVVDALRIAANLGFCGVSAIFYAREQKHV